MALFEHFPYTNFHDLNLDWILKKLKALEAQKDGKIEEILEKLDALKKQGSVLYLFPDLSTGGYSGNCSLMVGPEKTIMFDAGPTTDWSAIKQYYDQLYTAGIFKNIDYIVISHYHYDHVQNLASILAAYPHKDCRAYLPMNPDGYCTQDVSAYRTAVINALDAAGVPYTEVVADTDVEIEKDYITMSLFNSSPVDYKYYSVESPSIYNNFSMCALIRTGEIYSMFPGDIQRAAQIRLMNTKDLPRLFLYCVHHHGIQNDDYYPYLSKIEPEYSVIMTSHNRALTSAASSYSGNYLAGDVGSTGFSSYAYACGANAGSIIDGLTIPKIGWYYSYVDLYVDNTYTGPVYDGTVDHPFTQINEALMFVDQSSNLHYRIRVKGTGTRYGYTWIRDLNTALEIIGYKDPDLDVYPEVQGLYVRNASNVEVNHLIFNGTGRTIHENGIMVECWASRLTLSGCDIDCTNMTDASNRAVEVREAILYLTSCSISNFYAGIIAYRYGEVTTNNVDFANGTYCYLLSNLSVYVRGNDTASSVTNWMFGDLNDGRPYVISKNCIDAALVALNSLSSVSEPLYYDSSNPVCIMQGTHLHNVLTGVEVTL